MQPFNPFDAALYTPLPKPRLSITLPPLDTEEMEELLRECRGVATDPARSNIEAVAYIEILLVRLAQIDAGSSYTLAAAEVTEMLDTKFIRNRLDTCLLYLRGERTVGKFHDISDILVPRLREISMHLALLTTRRQRLVQKEPRLADLPQLAPITERCRIEQAQTVTIQEDDSVPNKKQKDDLTPQQKKQEHDEKWRKALRQTYLSYGMTGPEADLAAARAMDKEQFQRVIGAKDAKF